MSEINTIYLHTTFTHQCDRTKRQSEHELFVPVAGAVFSYFRQSNDIVGAYEYVFDLVMTLMSDVFQLGDMIIDFTVGFGDWASEVYEISEGAS